MSDEIREPIDERAEALRRLKKRHELARHAFVYVVINAAVWILWATTARGSLWPAWLSGLWAIGLVVNAWDVYSERAITEAAIDREVERLRATR